MAWKCSLELTHVYNIYCGNTPPRAPQLRRSVRTHNPLWVCETHPEGRGSIWVDLLSRRSSAIRKSAASSTFTTRGIDTLLPRPDPARHNYRHACYLSIRLPVSVSVFSFSFFFSHLSESSRVRTRTRRRTSETRGFLSPSPLCPVARKYFLGSPLIYHNRRLSSRFKILWTPGQSRPSRALQSRAIARVRHQLRP